MTAGVLLALLLPFAVYSTASSDALRESKLLVQALGSSLVLFGLAARGVRDFEPGGSRSRASKAVLSALGAVLLLSFASAVANARVVDPLVIGAVLSPLALAVAGTSRPGSSCRGEGRDGRVPRRGAVRNPRGRPALARRREAAARGAGAEVPRCRARREPGGPRDGARRARGPPLRDRGGPPPPPAPARSRGRRSRVDAPRNRGDRDGRPRDRVRRRGARPHAARPAPPRPGLRRARRARGSRRGVRRSTARDREGGAVREGRSRGRDDTARHRRPRRRGDGPVPPAPRRRARCLLERVRPRAHRRRGAIGPPPRPSLGVRALRQRAQRARDARRRVRDPDRARGGSRVPRARRWTPRGAPRSGRRVEPDDGRAPRRARGHVRPLPRRLPAEAARRLGPDRVPSRPRLAAHGPGPRREDAAPFPRPRRARGGGRRAPRGRPRARCRRVVAGRGRESPARGGRPPGSRRLRARGAPRRRADEARPRGRPETPRRHGAPRPRLGRVAREGPRGGARPLRAQRRARRTGRERPEPRTCRALARTNGGVRRPLSPGRVDPPRLVEALPPDVDRTRLAEEVDSAAAALAHGGRAPGLPSSR